MATMKASIRPPKLNPVSVSAIDSISEPPSHIASA